MERLKEKNCLISFSDVSSMSAFLKEMANADEVTELKLNTIETGSNQDDLTLSAIGVDGKRFTANVWPFAIGSLEKRSEDNAAGHRLMSDEEILHSMNNYWKLHKDGKICSARVRGDKIINLESSRYVPMRQCEIIDIVSDWLEDRHPDKYTFSQGSYSHEMTHLEFEVKDCISLPYKNAWKKAGLPESLLNDTKLFVKVQTNDIGESAAKAVIEMVVGGSRLLLGDPIEVIHKSGYGGIDKFRNDFDKIDFKVQEELDALSRLMGVRLLHPESAAIKALHKAGVVSKSKKACKELVEDMLFTGTESAYVVYLYLHGVIDTSYGIELSDYMKFRIITGLRGLLKEDWTKFDVPSATL